MPVRRGSSGAQRADLAAARPRASSSASTRSAPSPMEVDAGSKWGCRPRHIARAGAWFLAERAGEDLDVLVALPWCHLVFDNPRVHSAWINDCEVVSWQVTPLGLMARIIDHDVGAQSYVRALHCVGSSRRPRHNLYTDSFTTLCSIEPHPRTFRTRSGLTLNSV